MRQLSVDGKWSELHIGSRERSQPGWYSVNMGADLLPTVDSDVACPYCREPLRLQQTVGINRILDAEERHGKWWLFVQPVPATHRVLSCPICEVAFTLPSWHDADLGTNPPRNG